MKQQTQFPWGEEPKRQASRSRTPYRNVRPWRLDEKTRRAARKGIEDARRALEEAAPRPADAA